MAPTPAPVALADQLSSAGRAVSPSTWAPPPLPIVCCSDAPAAPPSSPPPSIPPHCREDAERRAERLRSQQDAARAEASHREQEAQELERQLQAARQQAAEAERKRESLLQEGRRLKEPSKRLNDEANE